MRKARVPFFRFAMNQSIMHKGFFVANPLTPEKVAHFESLAERFDQRTTRNRGSRHRKSR